MPEFSAIEANEFLLFTNFLGANFVGPAPGELESSFFYTAGPGFGTPSVEVEGVGLVADENGEIISGQVTGLRWVSYDYVDLGGGFYFPFQHSGIFDLDLPATQIAQALEDSWALDGPDQFASVAALFEGQELLLDYFFVYPVTIEDTLYDLLPADQAVRINGSTYADDLLAFQAGSVVMGNGGHDTVMGQDGNDRLFGGNGNDTIMAAGGNDGIAAGAGFDVVHGGDGDDRMGGGSQADNLFGDAGADTLGGGAGYDRLFGGTGNDLLEGGTEGDALFGQLGDDVLLGGADDDRLFGGAGFDTLTGGAGNDALTGNFNADTFVFADGFGMDSITDFASLNPFETIDLSAVTEITSLEDLTLNHLSQTDAGALITVDADNQITLLGVDSVDLDISDFQF